MSAPGFRETTDELLLLLPEGKPPFLGIIHEDLDLCKLKLEFLSTYEEKEIFVSFNRDRINLRVQMTSRDVVRFYSQLVYNRTELILWLDAIKNSDNINFGHLRRVEGKPQILLAPKTNQPFYFTVTKLYVLDFKDKAVLRYIR